MRFCAKDTIPQLAIMISIIMFLCNRIILTEEFVSTLSMNIESPSNLSYTRFRIVPFRATNCCACSSTAATVGESFQSKGRDHVFTDSDWSEFSADESIMAYSRSKTFAERRAYEIADAQSRWSLVTILPGIVQGPAQCAESSAKLYSPYVCI